MTLREHLEAIRHACELAGSDHYPWPLQRDCIACGFAHPCPTSTLAQEVKEHAVVALAILDAATVPKHGKWVAHRNYRLVTDPHPSKEGQPCPPHS